MDFNQIFAKNDKSFRTAKSIWELYVQWNQTQILLIHKHGHAPVHLPLGLIGILSPQDLYLFLRNIGQVPQKPKYYPTLVANVKG